MTRTQRKETLVKRINLIIATAVAAAACGGDAAPGRYGAASAQTIVPGVGMPDVTARRIWSPPSGHFSMMWPSVSPDGGSLVFCEFSDGNRVRELQVLDIASGEQRRLTHMGDEYCVFDQRVSRDGSLVAFSWNSASNWAGGLRVIGVDGTGYQNLVDNPEETWLTIADWSPDGHTLLATRSTPSWATSRSRSMELVTLTLKGELNVLRSFDWPAVREAFYSPDGLTVAYAGFVRDGTVDIEIFTLTADGRRLTRITDDGQAKTLLGWSSSGDALFYSSPGAGFSESIWRLPIVSGRRAGAPQLVRADIAGFDPVAFRDDRIYYAVRPRTAAQVLQLNLNLQAGTSSDQPETLSTSRRGTAGSSAWSHDGSRLAYVFAGRGMPETIIVRSMATGEEQEFLHGLERTDMVHWLTDGNSLIMYGERQGEPGTFEFDLRTGQLTPLLGYAAVPSADGSTLYALRGERGVSATLVAHDRTTGTERVLLDDLPDHMLEPRWISLAVSPAGDMLAYLHQADRVNSIRILPLDGREPWIAHTDHPDAGVIPGGSLAWSPDGASIVFGYSSRNQLVDGRAVAGTRGVGLVPAAGGPFQALFSSTTMINYITHLRLHPDGRRLAFRGDPGTAGDVNEELWVLENIEPSARR